MDSPEILFLLLHFRMVAVRKRWAATGVRTITEAPARDSETAQKPSFGHI